MKTGGQLAGLALSLWAALASGAAAAQPADPTCEEPTPAFERTLLPRPLKHAKWAALVDGGWSVLMTGAWVASARLWDRPQPQGLLNLLAVRVLYGTTHSVILASELALFRWLFEGQDHRLSKGNFHNEWWFGLGIPTNCSRSSAAACGLGLGAASELSVVVDQHLELALVGGWIQGHVEDRAEATVLESTWFEGPLVARRRDDFALGPFALSTSVGGGLFFGLHVAQAHPHGANPPGASPLELSVLGGGVGVGASARLRLEGPLGFRLEADADLVPLFGQARAVAPARVAPVQTEAGVPILRRFGLGLGFPPVGAAPVRLSARIVTMELSARPLSRVGHWMAVLAFDVPFVLDPPESDPENPPTCRPMSEKRIHSRTKYEAPPKSSMEPS